MNILFTVLVLLFAVSSANAIDCPVVNSSSPPESFLLNTPEKIYCEGQRRENSNTYNQRAIFIDPQLASEYERLKAANSAAANNSTSSGQTSSSTSGEISGVSAPKPTESSSSSSSSSSSGGPCGSGMWGGVSTICRSTNGDSQMCGAEVCDKSGGCNNGGAQPGQPSNNPITSMLDTVQNPNATVETFGQNMGRIAGNNAGVVAADQFVGDAPVSQNNSPLLQVATQAGFDALN